MERTQLESRLAALKDEFAVGRRLLAEQQARVEALRGQVLRISGAIRVVSELLAQPGPADDAARLGR